MEDFWEVVFEHLSSPEDFRSLGLTCKGAKIKLERFKDRLKTQIRESYLKKYVSGIPNPPKIFLNWRYRMFKYLNLLGYDVTVEDLNVQKRMTEEDLKDREQKWESIYDGMNCVEES